MKIIFKPKTLWSGLQILAGPWSNIKRATWIWIWTWRTSQRKMLHHHSNLEFHSFAERLTKRKKHPAMGNAGSPTLPLSKLDIPVVSFRRRSSFTPSPLSFRHTHLQKLAVSHSTVEFPRLRFNGFALHSLSNDYSVGGDRQIQEESLSPESQVESR